MNAGRPTTNDRLHSRYSAARDFAQDVRLALRQLRRAPGFAIVAVLTLAIGIGATTAIFSAVNAVVLRPLPFRAPDQLVRVYCIVARDVVVGRSLSAHCSLPGGARAARSGRIAPIETRSFTFADGAQLPQQAVGIRTTADYFPMLGVAPLLGRTFVPEEDRPGRSRCWC